MLRLINMQICDTRELLPLKLNPHRGSIKYGNYGVIVECHKEADLQRTGGGILTVRTINIESYGHLHANFILLEELTNCGDIFQHLLVPLFRNILNKLIK